MSKNSPTDLPTPKEIAQRIRDKVADLNDDLLLAALVEVDVEIMVDKPSYRTGQIILRAWCSQEV